MNYAVLGPIQEAFDQMWAGVIDTLPAILMAFLVFLVGFIVAGFVKGLVSKAFKHLNIDAALNAAGVGSMLSRAGVNVSAGVVVGTLVKWFVLVIFFIAALDILHLDRVTEFLNVSVLTYIPNVIVAVLILIVASIVANVAKNAINASTRAVELKDPEFFGRIAYYAIITLAVLAALSQLKVASELIHILFIGFVAGIAIAFGLAFGLGGKEAAARFIDSLTKK